MKTIHLVLLVIACPLEFVIKFFGLNKVHNPLMSIKYLAIVNRLWWILALSLPIFGLTQDGWAHHSHTGPPEKIGELNAEAPVSAAC